jgi:hypothetical protein
MSKKISSATHGIDLFAPGGLTQLFALHRATFGDAVMEAGDGGEGGAPDGGAGTGEPPAGAGSPPAGAPAQEPTDWKAEARKWEQRAKDNLAKVTELSPAAARLAEIEEANKTAEQKAAERFEALEKSDREKAAAIEAREQKLLRYEVAAAKGLDLKAALRLQGATKEELEADADDFAKSFIPGGVGEVPGAGAIGSTVRPKTTPGIGTLTHAYETAGK